METLKRFFLKFNPGTNIGTLHTKVKLFLSIISENLLNYQGISYLVIVLFIVKTYKLNRESNDATRNYMLVSVRAK